MLLLLLACTGSEGPGSEPAGTAAVTIALAGDVGDLLPILSRSALDATVSDAIYMPLVTTDFDCAVRFHPGLARTWTRSDDGRRLRVELRTDLHWDDGVPVTAEDVRFTWALVADPSAQSSRSDVLAAAGPPKVIDSDTLEWTFKAPTPLERMLLTVSAVVPAPKHALDGPAVDRASLRGHSLDTQAPVGNGPWRLSERIPGERIVLTPNPGWSGSKDERPRLGRVVFRVLPDHAQRMEALRTGAVDVADGVDIAEIDGLLADNPALQVRRRGWRNVEFVAWNTAVGAESTPHPLFADRAVRRALTQAIDIDRLITELLTSPQTGEIYGRPAVSTITPALCEIAKDEVTRLPFAPEDARVQLAELGWADTNNDGWLDREGQPFRFSLLVSSASPRRQAAADRVRAALATIGVDVKVEALESRALFERIKSGDYDAALSSWSAAVDPDPAPIWDPESEYNLTRWRDQRVADLLATAAAAPDTATAASTYEQLQRVIYEEQPYTFLYWVDEPVLVNQRLEGVEVDLMAPWRSLNRWWAKG